MSTSLDKLKEATANDLFKMTKAEAHEKGIYIDCKQPINVKIGNNDGMPGTIYSKPGEKDYSIHGMCEVCYDKIFSVCG